MGRLNPRRRVIAAVVIPLTTASLAIGGAGAALADTRPHGSAPATVSADALPTAQMNGVAWTQVIVGDTVYVGGEFTKARPAGAKPGKDEVGRRDLLAYSLSTGELLPWAPKVDGAVKGLAASDDGATVYAVGSFDEANGSKHHRIAGFDAQTGDVRDNFDASLNSAGYAVAVSGDTVYVGGHFTSANGKSRAHAAAFSRTNGSLQDWAPKTDQNVQAIVVSGSGNSAVLGGRFTKVNGQTKRGSERVSTSGSGKNLSWKLNSVVGNNGPDAAIYSLSTSGGIVYGTGYSFHPKPGTPGKRLEGTFAASFDDGKIKWLEDCHGDSYGATANNGVVYIAGHPHFCGNVGGFTSVPYNFQRAMAFTQAATHTLKSNKVKPYSSFGGEPAPSVLQWDPYFEAGTYTGQNQGPWTVASSGRYVAYAGEFKHINGHLQQGLARFAPADLAPNKEGPLRHGKASTTSAKYSKGKVTVTWLLNSDRDNQYLDYSVYRGTALIATVTRSSGVWYSGAKTSLTDKDGKKGDSYHVVSTDPFGNAATGATVKAK